jgi:hypothetical protein
LVHCTKRNLATLLKIRAFATPPTSATWIGANKFEKKLIWESFQVSAGPSVATSLCRRPSWGPDCQTWIPIALLPT